MDVATVQVQAPAQKQPIAVAERKPMEQLSPLKAKVPDPCTNACGYEWGNCTYGVALWREQADMPVGSDWGNASDWLRNAQASGVETGNTPQLNAVVWFVPHDSHGWGHVGLVTALNDNGTFTMREMNSLGLGVTNYRTLPNQGAYSFIY